MKSRRWALCRSTQVKVGLAFVAAILSLLPAQAQFTVLYSFQGKADGGEPSAGLILDASGNLYGTTYYGANARNGVVFMMNGAGLETVLYRFTGKADGGHPFAGVIQDSAGNLFGTATTGGNLTCSAPQGCGTVFKLDATGEHVLHTFNGTDGQHPNGGVVEDSAGNLYGTTRLGGSTGCGGVGCGVVFKLDPLGNYTVLHSFMGGNDGVNPYVGLTMDAAGNLYGTTSAAGKFVSGTVFKIDTAGHYTIINQLKGQTGSHPFGQLILDSAGNLYGTAFAGGTYKNGAIFKVDTSNQLHLLYSFLGGTDGASPIGGLAFDSAGNLYGTTSGGGITGCGGFGCGTVFKLDTTLTKTILHTFIGGTTDGANPYDGVTLDVSGNLYGTTPTGGQYGNGLVYEIAAAPSKR